MPNPTDPTVPNAAPIEKPNLVKRGVNFVKTHKKATIAVSLLTGLVVATAFVNEKVDSVEIITKDAEFEVPDINVT